ncbi:MAG: RagB/SusD family nutrient uptake outer membrane protein [Prevotellaceae bacterium]|jgi:hypothetical protein|nr:RagB/SusD family nutrient uptake outer membrane protein [Prevotellaceae bacterium]
MKKLIILLFSFAVVFTSCNKFTDLEPYDYIPEKDAMANLANANASLVGAYAGLRSYLYYGRNFVVWGDAPTNNVLVSPSNSNRFLGQAQWSITPSNADLVDLWNTCYSRLLRVNNIIVNVDDVPDATDANKDQIKGEALALRALIHFDLVRIFAQTYVGNATSLGIPYVTTVPLPSYQPERDTVNTVYTNIITDLDNAITLLADAAINRGPYHFTLAGVKALKARVVLTMGNYALAKTLAEEVIATPRFSLLTNSGYAASWSAETTTESIFTLAHSSNDYAATNALGYIYLQPGYGDLRVPPAFKALFDAGDVRQCFFIAGTGTQTTYTFVRKYPAREGIIGLDNYNMIRLSEMYLIAAEAACKIATPDETAAQLYLDAIRQRALPSAPAATETGQDLIDAILLEKRKELCYEGHYYFDQKRLQLPIVSAVNAAGVPYKTIPYPSLLLANPIPQREMDANPNMVQNPY